MIGVAPNVKMLFMRPVVEGFISYADLSNGGLTLYDIFVLNEFITYRADYDSCYYKLKTEGKK
jgi:hypothetical protein